MKFWQGIAAVSCSIVLLIGAGVCAICDVAISGGFTWSLYVFSSMVFGWLVLFPVIKFGVKGIRTGLIVLSVMIIPYIWVLSMLVEVTDLVLPLGGTVAVIGVMYLWGIYASFKHWRSRLLRATAACFLMAVPVNTLINLTLYVMIDGPIMDMWDVL